MDHTDKRGMSSLSLYIAKTFHTASSTIYFTTRGPPIGPFSTGVPDCTKYISDSTFHHV